MHISDFDYDLPDRLIAQQPLPKRDASRMLVVDRVNQTWHDATFARIPEYLREGDVLVVNNTRVFPARLEGKRSPSGGAVELLLLREVKQNVWEALARPARRLKTGAQIQFRESRLQAEVLESRDNGIRLIKFDSDRPVDLVIDEVGETPLPPYIKREKGPLGEDQERYQTVYASKRGAIAAPTAGLHFTTSVLKEIAARSVCLTQITLHVGYGTFEPVHVDNVENHHVGPEWFSIEEEAARVINGARKSDGRVIAVGTTTTRALESSVTRGRQIEARSDSAKLTIVPGYKFRVVDALLTNFHLPRSSLLMLVSAFAGRDLILKAYRHAVREGYRFYSYGDCMLIV